MIDSNVDKFEIDFLDVKDADAIFIHFYIGDKAFVVLIDAGNVDDASKIKSHLLKYYGTQVIDLAICTHPDSDHKGGFFGLLDDKNIQIKHFWLTDPAVYFSTDDIKKIKSPCNLKDKVRQIWDHPSDPDKNLIDILKAREIGFANMYAGRYHTMFPLIVLGPTQDYYKEIAKQMISEYGCKAYKESDTAMYDENALPCKDDIKSSTIDIDDDPSPYNASSLIIAFKSKKGLYLFAGDCNCASLKTAINSYGNDLKNITLLKVPHHGSKHNLTTEIINHLAPTQAIVSAAGTRKHPNSGIVYWINKAGGKVYSTHKSGSLWHHVNMPIRNDFSSSEELTYKK